MRVGQEAILPLVTKFRNICSFDAAPLTRCVRLLPVSLSFSGVTCHWFQNQCALNSSNTNPPWRERQARVCGQGHRDSRSQVATPQSPPTPTWVTGGDRQDYVFSLTDALLGFLTWDA